MTVEIEYLNQRIAQCRFKINIWLVIRVFVAGIFITYLINLEAEKVTTGQNITLFAGCLVFTYHVILIYNQYRKLEEFIDMLLTVKPFDY